MSEETTFYSAMAQILIIFNFLSIFFTMVILLVYAFLEYVGLEFLSIGTTFFGSSGFWHDKMIDLFELILEIPGGLDTLFMAIIFVAVVNVFYLAYKTQQGGWLGFFFFISLGLPVWLFIASKVVDLRDTLLNYLNSTLIIKPETTFFDYFTMYSLEVSAFIFITAIIIHMVDWENVREKFTEKIESSQSLDTSLEERFEQ